MKQLIFIMLSVLSFGQNSMAQIHLTRTNVTKEISMKIPDQFTLLTRGERIDKYVSAREPIAIYSNLERTIDLGINVSSTQWASGELEVLKSFYRANILNLFTEVNFITEEVREIGDREFIVFEFTSRVVDEDNVFGNSSSISKYTYIQYTVWENQQVLLFNFTSPARLREAWQPAAREIMESIRIK